MKAIKYFDFEYAEDTYGEGQGSDLQQKDAKQTSSASGAP